MIPRRILVIPLEEGHQLEPHDNWVKKVKQIATTIPNAEKDYYIPSVNIILHFSGKMYKRCPPGKNWLIRTEHKRKIWIYCFKWKNCAPWLKRGFDNLLFCTKRKTVKFLTPQPYMDKWTKGNRCDNKNKMTNDFWQLTN